jgi:hypothetical protein
MRLRLLLLALLTLPLAQAGCAMLEQTLALRQVNFSLDDVDNARLAGVNIDNVQSSQQLGATAMARIGAAMLQGELPLSFVMQIGAENPADNPTAARLARLDWILLLDDTETINGIFNDERLIEPGQRTRLPLAMELDLIRFFDRNLPSLVDLALAVGGHGQADVALRVRPTITTALGPISYPGYITLRHTVGN